MLSFKLKLGDSMEKQISALIMDEHQSITFYELCESCHVDSGWVVELVEYGILHPEGRAQTDWLFSGLDLYRSQKAYRLQHDLQLEAHALGVMLDLLDEVQQLRTQLKHVEKIQG